MRSIITILLAATCVVSGQIYHPVNAYLRPIEFTNNKARVVAEVPTNGTWAIQSTTDLVDYSYPPTQMATSNEGFNQIEAFVPESEKMFFRPRLIRSAGFVAVEVYGNDQSAQRGSLVYPARSIEHALVISEPDDTILVGMGEFPVQDSIVISNRSVIGCGMRQTSLAGGASGYSVIVRLAGNAYLESLEVRSTNRTGQLVFPINSGTDFAGDKEIQLIRVRVTGDSDCLSIGGGSNRIAFYASDCVFDSHYDAVIYRSTNTLSSFLMERCQIRSLRDPELFGNAIHCVSIGESVATLTDCTIFADGGQAETIGLLNRASQVSMQNVLIHARSDSGIVEEIRTE